MVTFTECDSVTGDNSPKRLQVNFLLISVYQRGLTFSEAPSTDHHNICHTYSICTTMTHKASSQRFPLEGFSKGQWSAHHTVSRHLELKPRQYNQSESLIMSKTALIGI